MQSRIRRNTTNGTVAPVLRRRLIFMLAVQFNELNSLAGSPSLYSIVIDSRMK